MSTPIRAFLHFQYTHTNSSVDSSAIDTLLGLAEKYQGYTKDAVAQTAGATKTAHQSDGGITAAEDDLKVKPTKFSSFVHWLTWK